MTARGKKIRSRVATALIALVFLIGVGLVAYPTVSDYVNKLHASRAVAVYNGAVEDLAAEELAALRESAEAYNAALADRYTSFNLSDEQEAEYESQLDLRNTAVMATLEISSLGISLPIYHGAEDTVLQIGIGHLPGSSLPVGGASTHTVLMGHRGLPSARLLTDLDKMRVGDTFCVTSLGEEMWYEVDQILIVEPEDTSALGIVEGEDLCTLVTCTPYGVNSHRLLVRGHRVDDPNAGTLLTADAFTIEPVLVASVLAIPVLAVCIVVVVARGRAKKRARVSGVRVGVRDGVRDAGGAFGRAKNRARRK